MRIDGPILDRDANTIEIYVAIQRSSKVEVVQRIRPILHSTAGGMARGISNDSEHAHRNSARHHAKHIKRDAKSAVPVGILDGITQKPPHHDKLGS